MRWPWWDTRSNDARALELYWDDIVRDVRVTPVPPPAAPPELSQIVRQLHLAEAADHSRPAYEDRLLQRLLANQQESTAMTSTARTLPVQSRASAAEARYPASGSASERMATGPPIGSHGANGPGCCRAGRSASLRTAAGTGTISRLSLRRPNP